LPLFIFGNTRSHPFGRASASAALQKGQFWFHYILFFSNYFSKRKSKFVMKHDFFHSVVNSLKGNLWVDGLFGIEKENIRVNKHGELAQTPHPRGFGNKLRHPYITTDFSESQIEMITPPLPDIRQTIGFLETIHDIVSLELSDEYLWPQSIPPILPDEKQIPIAQYGADGKDAQQYREFLAQKYSSKNQLFSGIHVNFSYSNKLLELLYIKTNPTISFAEFKNEAYLKTVRQMLRLRWLYILLFGKSPVVDSSLELQCKKAPFSTNKNVIALSIRNSCYGYRNLDDLYPDYSSVNNFNNSIDQMVQEHKLAAPKELYSPVRPKFTNSFNDISYVELRFIDIDPLNKVGITEEALYFLHALALYGLLTEEPDSFDATAQTIANNYYEYVALYGLNTSPLLFDKNGNQIDIWHKAKTHIQEIINLFQKLGIDREGYQTTLMHAKQLIENPNQRGIHDVLDGVLKMGYIPFHLDRARHYLTMSKQNEYNFIGLEDMELSTQLLLREAVKRGVLIEIMDRKENFVKLRRDDNVQYVKQATKTSLDNYASILAMENKVVTKKILRDHGLRVPNGQEYSEAEMGKADFTLFQNRPIVIKPNQTNFGTGITILKENTDEEIYQRAIDIAFEYDSTILIEEFIAGKEYRFFVIDNEVAGILHRVPANVTGDGTKSIQKLVGIKNQDPLRGKGYRTPLEKIQLGEAEAIFLQAQNKSFDYIPALGETIYLRENSNISTGGDSIDFTDKIPNSFKKIAIAAAKHLNVAITGLDMIIPDYKQEAASDNYAIIELNFNPAIHIHCYPFKGINRKLDAKLMDALGYHL
jgi:glutamate--cysteine ligase